MNSELKKQLKKMTKEEKLNFYIPKDMIPKEFGEFVQWRGIRIPIELWINWRHITVQDVLKETNMESRRLLISLMTVEKFLKDGGAVDVTKEDARGYQIVKIPLDTNDWYFLKMVNSTLEPGTEPSVTREGVIGGDINESGLKYYFLRLPESIIHKKITNEEAVSWSFQGTTVKKGAIYSNGTQKALENSRAISKFEEDKREFSNQARQGDVFIRKIADSYEDLMKGLMSSGKDGYDPMAYAPEIES